MYLIGAVLTWLVLCLLAHRYRQDAGVAHTMWTGFAASLGGIFWPATLCMLAGLGLWAMWERRG